MRHKTAVSEERMLTVTVVIRRNGCRKISLWGLIADISTNIEDVSPPLLHGVACIRAVVRPIIFVTAAVVHTELVSTVEISTHLGAQVAES